MAAITGHRRAHGTLVGTSTPDNVTITGLEGEDRAVLAVVNRDGADEIVVRTPAGADGDPGNAPANGDAGTDVEADYTVPAVAGARIEIDVDVAPDGTVVIDVNAQAATDYTVGLT